MPHEKRLFFGSTQTLSVRYALRIVLLLSLAMVLALLLAARSAQAQSGNIYVIDSLGDAPDANTSDGACATASGECTLRAAIQQANADAPNSPDDIDFGLPGQVTLTGPLPDITNSVNITGQHSGNTVFRSDGSGDYRIFNITGGATVSLDHLTAFNGFLGDASSCGGAISVSNGSTLNLTNSTINSNAASNGGGICNSGTTNIKDSTIGLNFATSGNAQGGGIYSSANGGNLSVVDSFFYGNEAGAGGGIYNYSGGMTVTGSTLKSNRATGSDFGQGGGGILNNNSGGSVVNSTFTGNSTNCVGGALDVSYSDFVNDTIAGNSAVAGGGISDYQGSSLQNTLVAKNMASSGAPDAYSAAGVPFTSRGNNLIGIADGSEGFANGHNGDQVGTSSNPLDPKLQTDSNGNPLLQDNGGPTQTIALMPSSPAVDAGSDSVLGSPLNLTTDQRGDGFPRKQGAHVDVGAFEAQPPADTTAPTVSITSGPADSSTTNSSSATFGFTASDAGSGIQSVECGLDGGSFGPCDTQGSQSYSNLSDGQHTFTVRATDKAGNQSSASRTWTVDTTAPNPPVINSPANGATLGSSSFTVSGTAEPDSTVELFEGTNSVGKTQADSSGNWSISLGGVSDGSHTYAAKATDQAGNTSAASSPLTLTVNTAPVDTTPPTVSSVSPANLATGVSPSTNVTATFSEAMKASSITKSTFKLYRAGTTTAIGATVSYSSTARKALLDPTSNLKAATRYRAVVTTGVQDLAGNHLAQSRVWYFTVKR